MLLYAGPDQIIPLTSAIGTALGFALVFWSKIVRLVLKIWDSFLGKSEADHSEGAQPKAAQSEESQ